MLLAGDIGGTKTALGIFSEEHGPHAALVEAEVHSADYGSLESIAKEFLAKTGVKVDQACFDVAGPVLAGRAKITNLPWIVDQASIAKELNLDAVYLLNDLEAIAYAVPTGRQMAERGVGSRRTGAYSKGPQRGRTSRNLCRWGHGNVRGKRQAAARGGAGGDATGPVCRPADHEPYRGKTRASPFRYFDKGNMAVVGKGFAVLQSGQIASQRVPCMARVGCRASSVSCVVQSARDGVQWIWTSLTGQRGSRLIVNDYGTAPGGTTSAPDPAHPGLAEMTK